MRILSKHFALAASGDIAGASGQLDYADLKPALDVADGIARVMNNKKLYLRLIGGFKGPKMAEDIVLAVESGDHDKVQQAAHALKGVCANLGMLDLTEVTLLIETRAKAEESAAELMPELNKAMDEAMAAIGRMLAEGEA